MKNKMILTLAALLIGGSARAQDWARQRGSEQQGIIKDMQKILPDKTTGKQVRNNPKGGADTSKTTPEMLVIDNWAYLAMPDDLSESVRSLGNSGVPKWVAVINGVNVEASLNRIKTPYDVITTVSKNGQNREELMSAADKKALRILGASFDKDGHLPAGRYLKIEVPSLTDFIKALTLYPRQVGFGFAVRRDK